jgi:hypothetical protein
MYALAESRATRRMRWPPLSFYLCEVRSRRLRERGNTEPWPPTYLVPLRFDKRSAKLL